MSEKDMQNVAIHELGHSVGLGHANFSGDPMYFAYSLGNFPRAISTLDTYGVGVVFRWMAYGAEYNSTNQGPTIYDVVAPPDFENDHLPVSEENLPPQSITDQIGVVLHDITLILNRTEVSALVLLAVAAFIAYAVLMRVMRKPKGETKQKPE